MQDATYRLLVLDDDATLRGAIRHWALRKGFAVTDAATADEARRACREAPVDLAILDIRLPDADGISLAESLIQEDPERPVILMTAYADLDSARRAIRVGVFEFFAKPISFDALEASIDRALQYRVQLIESRMRRTAQLKRINEDLTEEVEQRREGERALAARTRSLSEANLRLQQKDRLLAAYQGIAKVALSTLDLEEIVERVGRQLVEARIFKRLAIALVDEDSRQVEIVHQSTPSGESEDDLMPKLLGDARNCSLDGSNVAAVVARTGQMKVVDSVTPPHGRDVAFFIPIKTESRVIGVMAIGSAAEERGEMLRHIEAMNPMLDQIAFALDHALLYRASQDHARMVDEVNAELAREIDERKRAEEAVVRLERLGALGEMSAGVSHNLNNILTGILGPAELIEHMTDQENVLREADLIRSSAMRARDLVIRLHTSVRGEREKVGAVDLDRVVDRAIETGRPRWSDESAAMGRQVSLSSDLDSAASVAATDPGLQDVVLNLLFNAADALVDGGSIRVRTEKREDCAAVIVEDDGVGMEAEVKRRVFEPFFTTKANVGTGLGLSTVYGQVSRWGGRIDVVSEPGQGAVFEVELPLWREAVPDVADEPVVAERRGRILVVEDEDAIRDVVGRVLRLKHDVDTVEDGRSALDALKAGTYDVALIDLGMPDLPGDRVARKLRSIDSSAATVLMTGWNLAADDPRIEPFDLRIQKPFETIADVVDVVARAITIRDRRAGAAPT